MFNDHADSFFTQHGKMITAKNIKKSNAMPFKEHAQMPVLIDILSRRNSHHVMLQSGLSPRSYQPLLEALVIHLTQENIPHQLRNADLLFLDITSTNIPITRQITIENDFQKLRHALDTADKFLLIAITHPDLLLENSRSDGGLLQRQLQTLLSHPKCRFLMLSNQLLKTNTAFTTLEFAPPGEADIFQLLSRERIELENYHHVIIPDELLSHAYALAKRYLPANDTLEQTLLLLDSAAARATALDQGDGSNSTRTILAGSVLSNVLSAWTQIPASNLYLNKFKVNDFIQALQQKIFGQEPAIKLIAQELQQAHAHLKQRAGTFCNLLFAGPACVGKETTVEAIAEQLFKQTKFVYRVKASATFTAITDIKLQRNHDHSYVNLLEVIRKTPFALILFEDIENMSKLVLEQLSEILSTGHWYDENGMGYDFSQTICVLTTTIGTTTLVEQAKLFQADDETCNLDLLQLVLREPSHAALNQIEHSPQELVDAIFSEISHTLPMLFQHVHIVPFLPLNKSAIENIVCLSLKALGKNLDTRYGVELSYAPEVIRYLANELLIKQEMETGSININKVLKELYYTVEQSILGQSDNKHRPTQLFLQLNETGQQLRCDSLVMAPVRQHSL